MNLFEISAIYGDATKALYEKLAQHGPAGSVAINLFRACKASERAKVYRGGDARGRYRRRSYERKEWSIGNLTMVLAQHAAELGLTWGWKRDEAEQYIPWVGYIAGILAVQTPQAPRLADMGFRHERHRIEPKSEPAPTRITPKQEELPL